MVTATIDNTPVTVQLSGNETYTPASGSIQKVTTIVEAGQGLGLVKGGNSERIVRNNKGSGEPNAEAVEMVISDTETLKNRGDSQGGGIYISGFEVS